MLRYQPFKGDFLFIAFLITIDETPEYPLVSLLFVPSKSSTFDTRALELHNKKKKKNSPKQHLTVVRDSRGFVGRYHDFKKLRVFFHVTLVR